MADLPTPAELIAVGQAAFRTALDPSGTGAVDLQPGSRNDTLLSVVGAVGTRLAQYAADRVTAQSVTNATGDDLAQIARDVYRDPKKGAAAAVGTVYLERSASTATLIPAGSRFGVPAANGKPATVFRASADVATTDHHVAVRVVADQDGAAGNVSLASITAILDPLADTGWSLVVPAPGMAPADGGVVDVIGGGADVETDEILRARLMQISIDGTKRAGTGAALLKATLAVPGVQFATIIEPLDGTSIVYAGDANYALPFALRATIETALLDWRCNGVPAFVRAYNATQVQVGAIIFMGRSLSNYDTADLQTKAIAQIIEYFQNRVRADEYYLAAIEGACFKAHIEIQDVQLAAPLANQQRPADTGYGAIVALNRYFVNAGSIAISFAPPQHT